MRNAFILGSFVLVSTLLMHGVLTALASFDWTQGGKDFAAATAVQPARTQQIAQRQNQTGPIAYTHPRSLKRALNQVIDAQCTSLLFNIPEDLAPFTAKPLLHKIPDGDTFTVRREKGEQIIRLWGIDAPEKTQPFGSLARDTLELELQRHQHWIFYPVQENDGYGRTVAIVAPPHGGVILNAIMVRRGFAYWDYRYARHDACLSLSEQQARHEKRYLWRDDKQKRTLPWNYRLQRGEAP